MMLRTIFLPDHVNRKDGSSIATRRCSATMLAAAAEHKRPTPGHPTVLRASGHAEAYGF
jgi:hypothetical protein